MSARRIRRIQSRSKRCFAVSRGAISFTGASAFPQNDSRLWAVCPGKQVKYCLLEFEGLADIEPKLVTLRPSPRKQTDAIYRPSRLVFATPPTNARAALSTASLILFSLDVIAHAYGARICAYDIGSVPNPKQDYFLS